MKVIDISMDVAPDMAVWTNNDAKRPQFKILRDYAQGAVARETQITMDMHTGTHIDAPLHFIEGGRTMESIALESLVRSVKVLDLTDVEDSISEDDLVELGIEQGDFILFKTRNSFRDDFDMDFVFLNASGTDFLVERGILGVGTDSLGIERSQEGHETHKGLLGNGIVIIEGLRLAHVVPGTYQMVAAPLKIPNVEAAPARVFLMASEA